MTLQTRVTALEKDVATLRSRADNADVERDDIKRQLTDLRAEMHGWAQVTVRTDQKMDAAAQLMQLIYADLRQVKDTLEKHGKRFDQVDKRFDQVDKRFDQVDKRFDQVDKRLDQHDKRFDQHDKRFDQVDKRFDQHDKRFDQHDKRFDQVDEMLRQILAKVS